MAYGFNDDMSKAEFVEIQHNPTREEMIEYASTIGITLRTADPLETWATVLLSYLCNKYVGKSRTVFTGVLNRNTLATYKVLIYDTSKTNGTYNLPQYSIGSIQEYANLKMDFGTESYTFKRYEYGLEDEVDLIEWEGAAPRFTCNKVVQVPRDGYIRPIKNDSNGVLNVSLMTENNRLVTGMDYSKAYFVKKGMRISISAVALSTAMKPAIRVWYNKA